MKYLSLKYVWLGLAVCLLISSIAMSSDVNPSVNGLENDVVIGAVSANGIVYVVTQSTDGQFHKIPVN